MGQQDAPRLAEIRISPLREKPVTEQTQISRDRPRGREGLKIGWPSDRAGSSPAPGIAQACGAAAIRGVGASRLGQPKVKTYASAPGAANSISIVRSAVAA